MLIMKQLNRKIYTFMKWSLIVCLFTTMTIILVSFIIRRSRDGVFEDIVLPVTKSVSPVTKYVSPPSKNWRNLSEKQIQRLSVLGRYLFLNEPAPVVQISNTTYKILTWLVGKCLEKRHIYHFTQHKFDPFANCSVRNCEITYNHDELPRVDAVMIHLFKLKGVDKLPKENGPRPENQRWVFLTDENPLFTFQYRTKIEDLNGKFNWSMTYRLESDVPVPYGRTLLKKRNLNSINKDNPDKDMHNEELSKKKQDVLVAIMATRCECINHRWQYVKELQKYIQVDFYGYCGTLKCPGHFSKDCEALGNYKFYLSFENSNCAQYITEKVWWNAYAKNSIPIVMGASKLDYSQLLPPNSYINVDNFARPQDLAQYILYVNNTNDIYQSYFEWKKYYEISNEHGFFQTNSYHYCRLCEALNYNSKEKKVYNNFQQFWTKNDCYSRWDK